MRPYVEYIESVVESGRLLRDWEGCSQSDAVIVAGDYNAVSGSWAHRKLIIALGLQDAQMNTGLSGATWPAEAKDFLQMPVFRIDHVLHHPDLKLAYSKYESHILIIRDFFCRLIDSINDECYGCTLIRLSNAISIFA